MQSGQRGKDRWVSISMTPDFMTNSLSSALYTLGT